MKYKIGDKVKIKTWEQMEKEFKLEEGRYIVLGDNILFGLKQEKELNQKYPDRIMTIKTVTEEYNFDFNSIFYKMEENNKGWTNDMIECLVEDYINPACEPIKNRFDIMDFGD